MKKYISWLLLSFVLFSSCTKDETEDLIDNTPANAITSQTRAVSEIDLTPQPNPYALKVMQGVYDSYKVAKKLLPTDVYVRFLPQDSVQLSTLKYDYKLELFDHPLDIEIPEDAVYMDPTLPEGDFTWLYATVKPNFVFPKAITYEILEQCYIPEEGEEIVTTRGGTANVEEAAFISLGYVLEPEPETRAKVRPEGIIRVYDNSAKSYVPVKGVKIRCHRFVKWSTTFTDENGHYTMDSKFRYKPHYAIVFDNAKDFDIWGNWGPLARANLNMGWHSSKGHSRDIKEGSFAWDWAAVNNAAYDYYKMCEATGISKPPRTIKIWVFKGWTKSSAPMLRRVKHAIGLNGHSDWTNFFVNIHVVPITSILRSMLKCVLPDITIGTKGSNYRQVYNLVNHELSHASHFSTVGSAHWAKYISYIITYGGYGDGTGRNAQLCGVGEMWGYSMGHIQEFEKYAPEYFLEGYPYTNYWMKPHVFWDLVRFNILTKKQIYDCLAPGVVTYDTLVAKMYENHPDKAFAIEKAFLNNEIIPKVPLPSEGSEIPFDAFYRDKSVKTSSEFTGNDILAQNISVTDNAMLTLGFTSSITIKGPFTVERGSQLILTRNTASL